MMKLILVSAALMSAQIAMADGQMEFNLRPQGNGFTMDANHSGSSITGSISPARLSPFINLQSGGTEQWQGSLGQQISSTEVTDQGNGRFRVTIAALPGGFYTYSVTTKSNGNTEVYGTGPTGNLNSAGLKRSGTEIYFNNSNFSFDLTSDQNGTYSGLVVAGAMNSGTGYLTASGDLDPAMAVTDPALFVLLYVFPFSQ